jgi:putative oxidoreductase
MALKIIKYRHYVYCAGLYLIAAVLIFSGISKIMDPMPLIETFKLVAMIPEEVCIIIAAVLSLLEIGLGLLLMFRCKPKLVLSVTLVLFAVFLAFSIYGTIVGMNNDCGCFGRIIKSEIGWKMVGRNIIILLAIIGVNKLQKKEPLIRVNKIQYELK